MSHEQHGESKTNTVDSKSELKAANERRIEALLEINNRYLRTTRHLEQHSNISSPEQIKHSLKVQEEREARMENLKDIIAYGHHAEVDEKENIKRNLEYTGHYLQHHSGHMDQETLERSRKKQEHRKEQLHFLD